MRELVRSLMVRFRKQLPTSDDDPETYIDASLAIGPASGRSAARAWVGIFAEAIRSPSVLDLVRRRLQTEVVRLEKRFRVAGCSSAEARQNAAGVLSNIVGCLVFGALMPSTTRGFAAPYVQRTRPRSQAGKQTFAK